MLLFPTNRMLLIAAALATPLLGLAGWVGQGWPAMGLALILMAVLAALDALGGRSIAKRVRVSLEVSMHATQGRQLEVAAMLSGPRCRVRVGVDWPDGCEACERIKQSQLQGKAPQQITWQLTPHQRGEVKVGAVHHEVLSPLGLWAWRSHSPASVRVRVYPALHEDRGVLAPLFLRRAAAGLHVVRQVGKGREFEQLREYLPGDSYEDIYWKGTARRGAPVTKIHQIERTQDVYIVIDASRHSMRRLTEVEAPGQPPTTQMDRFVRAGMALALTAIQQGDRPGLAVFGPTLRHFVRAGGGPPQYAAMRDVLYDVQARPEPPDFADTLADLGNRLRHRALLLFLTDLDDPVIADQFCDEIKLFARRHVVLVGQLQGPGIAPIFDRRQCVPSADGEVYGRLAGHLLWQGSRQTGNRLRAEGIHWVPSHSESLVSEMVSSYINIKRRQLL